MGAGGAAGGQWLSVAMPILTHQGTEIPYTIIRSARRRRTFAGIPADNPDTLQPQVSGLGNRHQRPLILHHKPDPPQPHADVELESAVHHALLAQHLGPQQSRQRQSQHPHRHPAPTR